MKTLARFISRQDKIILLSNLISICCIIIIVNLFAWYYPYLPHQIPLFYSREWGEPQMAALGQFSIMPFIILLSLLLNLILNWQLHDSQLILKRILSLTSAIISIILTISATHIVSIFV